MQIQSNRFMSDLQIFTALVGRRRVDVLDVVALVELAVAYKGRLR